jgi:hypothetical protein
LSSSGIRNTGDDDDRKVMEIVEKALELAGTESKSVILNYMREKYAVMSPDALVRYRDEFANYLHEVLGDSADIIVAKIERAFEEQKIGGERRTSSAAAAAAAEEEGMPVCYICNASVPPEKMRRHLARDHTKEDLAHHLSVIYVDDWREEAELREENSSQLQQLLRN